MDNSLVKIAKLYSARLGQWATICLEFIGDGEYVSRCEKWCQQLDDEPESLIQLLDNAIFLKVMAEATHYIKNKK